MFDIQYTHILSYSHSQHMVFHFLSGNRVMVPLLPKKKRQADYFFTRLTNKDTKDPQILHSHLLPVRICL